MALFRGVWVLLFLMTMAVAQAGLLIRFDGVSGTSTRDGRKDYSSIDSFTFSINSLSEDKTVARPRATPLLVSKPIDRNSPAMAGAAAGARVFKEVIIELADGRGQKVYEIILKDVRLVEYSVSGSGDSGETPRESYALEYQSVEWVFHEANSKGGTPTSSSSSWDVRRGTVK